MTGDNPATGRQHTGYHTVTVKFAQISLEMGLLTQEHAQTAREFLKASDREFDAGDHLQASEKLWGAAAHALMAARQERGISGNSHRALRFHAEKLAWKYGDPDIRLGFHIADKFHRNFYNDFMDDSEYELDRPIVHDFVERVLSLPMQG